MEQKSVEKMGGAPVKTLMLAVSIGTDVGVNVLLAKSLGQQDRERVMDGVRYGLLYTLIIMAAGTLLLELFAGPLCALFGLSGVTQGLCVSATRLISLGFLFAGVSIALQGVFQALGCGISSFVVSLCRQILFVLPVAWLFTRFIAPDLSNAWIVWLTFPLAEFITAAVAAGLMLRAYRARVKPLEG